MWGPGPLLQQLQEPQARSLPPLPTGLCGRGLPEGGGVRGGCPAHRQPFRCLFVLVSLKETSPDEARVSSLRDVAGLALSTLLAFLRVAMATAMSAGGYQAGILHILGYDAGQLTSRAFSCKISFAGEKTHRGAA